MRKKAPYKSHTLVYETSGSGPAVVLLHGFGETAAVWNDQVARLGKDYYLIVPQLPGTDDAAPIDDMSLEGLAEAIRFLLQHEKIDRCFLIGHSMGGYITLAFAEKYSTLLLGLGLFHSSAYADSPEKIATRRKGIAFMQQHGGYEFLKTSIPNLYSAATKAQRPSLIEQHLSTVKDMAADSLISYYESMIRRPDRTMVLKNAPVPVLFVLGSEDMAVPLEQGLEQCSLPDLCYIHILDQSGHMGMREEPEQSNDLLIAYLSTTLEIAAT
jgi:pimeloyl-ACP methyl ester carboxylesterase